MERGQKFKAGEIIGELREAEVELARGKKIPEVCKQIGVTQADLLSPEEGIWRPANGSGLATQGLPLVFAETQ